ncbi:PA14 domain-containing protein [Robertmurraya korlensis]|uniref:PA14 domain-containing protein n=1 Tax=Robertmurraya korlensis TaxID=519977 RepID=UPI0008249C98|nr:PA14 domain-containing protein [Robertmurraya korlensis]
MKHNPLMILFLLLSISFITNNDVAKAADFENIRVIVLFQGKVNNEVIYQAKGIVIDEIKGLNAVVAEIPTSALKTIQFNPIVKLIEVDQVLEVGVQREGWGILKINAPNAWTSSITGKGIKVAVLDSGISPHEDLQVAGGVSFVSYTSSYYDDNGHGTHVAGVIGAKRNSIGVVGVAPDASIYSVKVMDQNGEGYLSDLIAGVDWAISNKMDIINLSISSPNGSYLLKQSVDKAYNSGLLVVAAAGNNGKSDGSGDTVEYPAKYSSVIAVSATDSNDKRGSFSATGDTVEVAAPGVSILSTYPTNMYVTMSGTSMATPFVAGNLALLKQVYPSYTNQQLRELLQTTVKDIGVSGRDAFYGYGLIQSPAVKGWNVEYFSNQISLGKEVYYSNDINKDWGLASPNSQVPADYFTARFTKSLFFKSGLYKFEGNADDSIKVSIDGQEVANFTGTSNSTKLVEVSEGEHVLTVEYTEQTGPAKLFFTFNKLPLFTSTARDVNVNWGWGSPGNSIPSDYFTWTFDQSGSYQAGDYFVQALADDGVRVEIDGTRVIDQWTDYNGKMNRFLWTNISAGNHSVKTHYYEHVASAGIQSNVVPFDSWIAYYYPNRTLSGFPVAAKVIQPVGTNKKLSEYYTGSPAPGIGNDQFSARFTTAKRITEGDYILRTKADDGVRVYVDGHLVLDRWTTIGEEAIKLHITNNQNSKPGEENVHWIEVEYHDVASVGYVDVGIEPYDSAYQNTWVGEFYPNTNFEGTPVVIGGVGASSKLTNLNFNWGWNGSPHPAIPADRFTARFLKKDNLDMGKYLFKVEADDAARVYLDNQLILDTWPGSTQRLTQKFVDVTAGEHSIVVEYMEDVALAKLSFGYQKYTVMPTKIGKEVRYNWGWGSPGNGIPSDYFTGIFDQSGSYASGDYFVQTFADDGVKVEINGNNLIDRWTDYTGGIERALWLGVPGGNQTVKTHYIENVASAGVFSDIVPFNSWLTYYYPNMKLSGMPVASKVITPSGNSGALSEYFAGSPASGIGNDYFSARYTTARRISSGDYILRTKVDDGVRVYVDGKLVLDRWGKLGEEAIKLSIADHVNVPAGERDIHWIEVEYREEVSVGYIDVTLEPFEKEIQSSWVAEYYSNNTFSGIPYVVGGIGSFKKLSEVKFDWGWAGSPHPSIPADHFTARFTKLEKMETGKYMFTVQADDAARVFLNKELILDTWPGTSEKRNQVILDISSGDHLIEVQYLEEVALAKLDFKVEIVK